MFRANPPLIYHIGEKENLSKIKKHAYTALLHISLKQQFAQSGLLAMQTALP